MERDLQRSLRSLDVCFAFQRHCCDDAASLQQLVTSVATLCSAGREEQRVSQVSSSSSSCTEDYGNAVVYDLTNDICIFVVKGIFECRGITKKALICSF